MTSSLSYSLAAESTLPPSRYRCLLDVQPTHLVPPRLLSADPARDADVPLIVSPQCRFVRDGAALPASAADAPLLGHAAQAHEMVWVDDPVTGTCWPFWLGLSYSALLAHVRPGDPAPDLPPEPRAVLAQAGVLVSQDSIAQRQAAWADVVARAAEEFRRGYAPLRQLIHPYHIGALRRYYRYLIRTGRLQLGDGQSPRRYAVHNEPVARFFHQQLTALVGMIVGKPVKPSYVYFASYRSGAELPRHTDREQCEYSITFLLDTSPEPVRESPWPISLDTPEGVVRVFQCIGDGLLYRGRRLPHYREQLWDGYTSASFFFHYVDADFAGSLR